MADFYIDHGAYATALGASPTWGVPQEGDGSSKDAAVSASVGSIQFGSVPTSGTVSVCGISVSTSGVIGAASVDAAANALASNINAATSTVAAAVAVGTPQLRNLVFARGPSGGAPAGTCQVMMRVGSTTLNYSTNASAALASSFDGSPTVTQFAGGSGGCWGYFINASAMGASNSIAAASYGLGVSKPCVWTATPTTADYVYCRTGSGKTITLGLNVSFTRGNVGFPINLVFDTNTKWTSDSGTGVFVLRMSSSGSSTVFRPDASLAAGNSVSWQCLLKGNFNLQVDVSSAGAVIQLFYQITAFVARGIRVSESAAPSATSRAEIQLQAGTLRLNGCDFDFGSYARANISTALYFTTSAPAGLLEAEDCDFRFNLNGVPADTAPLFGGTLFSGLSGPFDVVLRNNRFTTNSAYKIKLFTTTMAASATWPFSFVAQNNSGLSLDAAALGFQNVATFNRPSRMNSLVFIGDNTSRHQRMEQWNGIAEWNPNAATPYPTLSAQQPDGTAYSIRLYWLQTSAQSPFTPFSYRSTLFNRLSDGARTVTQELFYDTSRSIDRRSIGIEVRYVDTSGNARCDRTLFSQDPVASSAPWANAGSYAGFNARKLSITTSYAVKQNTEISVDVVLVGQAPGSGNTDVYIDPEFSIT